MNKLKDKKIIPDFALFPLIAVVIYNFLVYCGARWLVRDSVHYNITSPIDGAIPFLPWTVFIYLIAYVFWIAGYILSTRFDRTQAYRFCLADLLGKTVCLFFFVFMPCTLSRPEITGGGFTDSVVALVYQVDKADNLFPSIHCFVSFLCWLGVKNNHRIPKGYRVFSLIFAIAICISTLTVKQHVIYDAVAGIALAYICYYLSGAVMRIRNKKAIIKNPSCQ